MDPEKIILELDASKVESGRKPLHALIEDLKGIENHAKAVNQALNGMSGIGSVTGIKDLNAEIEAMQRTANKKGGGGVADIVKRLNLDADSFDRYLNRYKAQVKEMHGYNAKTREFGTIGGAAGAVHRYQQGQTDIIGASGLALGKWLTRPVAAEANSGAAGAEIVAALKELTAKLAMGPAAPTATEAGREAGTGHFTGEGGKGGKKKPKPKQELNLERQPGEIERTRVETEETLRETIVQATELGTTVATTYDSVDAILKTVTKSNTAKTLKDQLKQQRALSLEGFKAAKQGMGPAELAKLQISQASALEGLITPAMAEELKDSNQGHVGEQIMAQAATLRAQARVNQMKAGVQMQKDRDKRLSAPGAGVGWEDFAAAGERDKENARRMAEQVTAHENKLHDRQRKVKEKAMRDAAKYGPVTLTPAEQAERDRKADVEQATRNNRAASLRRQRSAYWDRQNAEPVSPFARGMHSFTPVGIAANLLNVSGWALSVGLLYKSLEAVNYSLTRMVSLSEGVARLGNMFHGIGGSARELAGDLVGVAAAQGRTSEEMLSSGMDFSRIYRSRGEVAAAGSASAKLANATGMGVGPAGGMLGVLARVYGVPANQLEGQANQFVGLSQRYKVAPEEMAGEVQRNAQIFKRGGFNSAQMMEMMMGTAGKSGLSGTGAMFRTGLQNLRMLPVQEFLRQRGIGAAGGSAQEMMAELAHKMGGIGEREKGMIAAKIAGTTGADRWLDAMRAYKDILDGVNGSLAQKNALEESNNRILNTSAGAMRQVWGRMDQVFLAGSPVDHVLAHSIRGVANMYGLLASREGFRAVAGQMGPFGQVAGGVMGASDSVRDTWSRFHPQPKAAADVAEGPNTAVETEEPLDLREQRVATSKARHQMGGEMLGSLFGQFPQDLMSVRMSNRIGLLRGEDERIGSSLGGLQASGVPGPESMAEINRLDERRREVRGELSAAGAAAPLAEMFDRRQLAFTRAGQEAQGYGVGTWEAEKLTNRRNELTNQLRRAPGPGGGSENEQVRALQMEIDLWRTKEQIQERIIALRAEEKQIALDANREFSRSLITAGPGELLRKLAVLKLGGPEGKSLTAGGFFAMDAGSRGIYDQLRGGEAGARNRAERRLLGTGQSVEQQQAERRDAGGKIAARENSLGRSAANAGDGALGNEAKIAAANLTAMSGALASATAAVLAFAKALPGGGGAAKPAAAPGGGISTGYQVGSNPPPAKDFHDGSTVLTGFHL